MSMEHARNIMAETRSDGAALKYVHVTSEIQQTIDIAVDQLEFADNPSNVIANRYYNPINTSLRHDPGDSVVKAAMLNGAISLKGHRYRKFDIFTSPIPMYEDVWRNTSFQGLAAKCDEMVEDLKPQLDGKYTHVNLVEMQADFVKNLEDGNKETLVVTGLNGVGKSTQIKALMSFLRMCNIKSELIKFPRVDGLFGKLLTDILSGKTKTDPRALQHTMFADALDKKHQSDTFIVHDRDPRRDAPVYGPLNMVVSLLAANEIFEGNLWTVILDRHFKRTHTEVENRKVKPRIFEKKIDAMIDQYLRYAGLTYLPGVIWINGDTASTTDNSWPIEYTMRKFFGGIFSTGAIQRHMLQHGLTNSTKTADGFLRTSFFEFLDRWKTTPNWIKNLS